MIPVPQHIPTWHQCWLSLIMRGCWSVFLLDSPYLVVGNTSELNAPRTLTFNELARLVVYLECLIYSMFDSLNVFA